MDFRYNVTKKERINMLDNTIKITNDYANYTLIKTCIPDPETKYKINTDFKTCLTSQNSMILVLGQHSYDTSNVPVELTKMIEESRTKYFTFLLILMGAVSIFQAFVITGWTEKVLV